jgi:gas vesicle protein
MGKLFRFLFGVLLGALVGAALGILLAPQAGDETQAAIRQRLDAVIEDGRRAAAERRAELEAQFAEAKQVARPK